LVSASSDAKTARDSTDQTASLVSRAAHGARVEKLPNGALVDGFIFARVPHPAKVFENRYFNAVIELAMILGSLVVLPFETDV
jgi:hypothetical protein